MMNIQITFSNFTHKGNLRDNNEDALWPGTDEKVHPHLDKYESHGLLFVIADGMGGHQAGNVASGIAVKVIKNVYYSEKLQNMEVESRLEQAIREANSEIREYAKESSLDRTKVMGTTVVAAVIKKDLLTVGWVGDSRAYLLRNNHKQFNLLTKDHSTLWPEIENKNILWEDLYDHPQRSEITRALAAHCQTADVDFAPPCRLEPGDRILLCSDGLTSEIRDEDIKKSLKLPSIDDAVVKLKNLALDEKTLQKSNGHEIHTKGGNDNVTATVIEISDKTSSIIPAKKVWVRSALWTIQVTILFFIVGIFLLIKPVIFDSPALVSYPTALSTSSIADNFDISISRATDTSSTKVIAFNPSVDAVSILASTLMTSTLTATPTPIAPTSTIVPVKLTSIPTPLKQVATSVPVTPTPKTIPMVPKANSSFSDPSGKYPAPQLIEPNAGELVPYNEPFTFRWSWDGTLRSDESFEIKLWQGDQGHNGAFNAYQIFAQMQETDGIYSFTGKVYDKDSGAGSDNIVNPKYGAGLDKEYNWTVVVVRLTDEEKDCCFILSPEATPRVIFVEGPGSGPSRDSPNDPNDAPSGGISDPT